MLLFGSVLTTFTNPIIAAVADSMQAQKALMILSMGGQAVCQLAMLAPSLGYRGLLILVTLHKLIGEHAFPIMDASTMTTCGDEYGPIRLWGAIGFGGKYTTATTNSISRNISEGCLRLQRRRSAVAG